MNEKTVSDETPESNETTKKVSLVQTVCTDVDKQIKGGAELVRAKLVELLVNRELDERVALLDTSLKKRSELEREVYKAKKPDQKSYNESGDVVSTGFTAEALKKLIEAKEKLAKFDKAVESALAGDFQKLKEMK